MRITHSDKITEILTGLAHRKQLKEARPLAIFSTASNTATAEEFIKILYNKYPGAPDLVRGVAVTSDTSFFFDIPEVEVIEKLEDIRKRERGKTAPKVIVKMIYSRLAKILKKIQNMQRILDEDKHGYYQGKWVVPELTRESLVPGMSFDVNTCEWELLQASRDLGQLLHRDDFTEELIDEAWKLFQTHKIMEE